MEQFFIDEDALRDKETIMGAIIGDVAGSRFEFNPIKSKDFNFFSNENKFTDDTVMTVAIAQALLEHKANNGDLSELAIKNMKAYGNRYSHAGYGGRFRKWLADPLAQPYGSFGNGSAMRISALAYAAKDLDELHEMVDKVTVVTHNHPEGIKGARAVADCIWLAFNGKSKQEIKQYVEDNYYKLDFDYDEIVANYSFDVTCQGSVPQSIYAFLISDSFEDTIRTAISMGGDADTMAAIAGSIAGAYYVIPEKMIIWAKKHLPVDMLEVIEVYDTMLNYLWD